MDSELKEILAKVQKIQADLLGIRTVHLDTQTSRPNYENIISVDVTFFEPLKIFCFANYKHDQDNEEEYIRLLNYLNAEDFAEIHKELDSEMESVKEHWCDDCEDDCDKCIKTKAHIVTKEDF